MKTKLLCALLLLAPLFPFAAETNAPSAVAADQLTKLRATLSNRLGNWNVVKEQPRLVSANPSPGHGVGVVILLNNSLFSDGFEYGFKDDVWKIAREFFTMFPDENELSVAGLNQLQNAFGEQKFRTVGLAIMTRANFERIVPKNFLVNQLDQVTTYRFKPTGFDLPAAK